MHNRRNLQNVFGIFLPTWNPSWHFLNPSWPDHMSDSFLQQSTLTNYVKPVQIRSKILYIYELNCILWTNSYCLKRILHKPTDKQNIQIQNSYSHLSNILVGWQDNFIHGWRWNFQALFKCYRHHSTLQI